KFSKWRDAGTGIQPFVPAVPARSQQSGLMRLAQGLKSFVVGPALAVVRLAVLGATALLDALTASMGVLIVVPGLRRPATLFLRRVWARLALFALGFMRIEMRTVSLQRGRRNTQEAHVSSGDIIVVNHASYVDILILAYLYDPVFVELDNATCYARRISLYQALRAPAQMTPALLPANEAEPLKAITEQARVRQTGPVVVFAENATSNGRALLQLLPVFGEMANLDEKAKIHVLALKYPFSAFSPAYSVGSQLMHVFQLCCQMYNSVSVRVLAAGEAPRMADSALLCDADEEPVDLDERVQECLVGVSRLRMTKMTAMDKRDFLKFYNAQK
ncbi:Vacuolar protein sorting protein vps66, partial [Linderina pennispora]